MKTIKEAIESNPSEIDLTDLSSNMVQYKVRENKRKPGEPIFVREDGKVGFPTINSIQLKIGDIVRGKIQYEEPNYFLIEVREKVGQEDEEA